MRDKEGQNEVFSIFMETYFFCLSGVLNRCTSDYIQAQVHSGYGIHENRMTSPRHFVFFTWYIKWMYSLYREAPVVQT